MAGKGLGKGLGTGLGALFGEDAFEENPKQKEYLPISKIEPRQDQPRSDFDEKALAELAGSLTEHGMIQPITVRELDSGYYQIVAGERRWRAARLAGLKEVPVRVLEADDKKAMEIAMVENLQREDLNPVEEAKGYRTLMREYGMTQEAVASVVGKSRPVVANALRLLALPEKVLSLLEEGKLTLSHARVILEADGDDVREKVAIAAAEKELTVRQTSSLIKKMEADEYEKPKKSGIQVDYVAEVEKELSKKLSRKVKIVYGRKKGRIEIEYYGSDDFENICSAIKSMEIQSGGNEN